MEKVIQNSGRPQRDSERSLLFAWSHLPSEFTLVSCLTYSLTLKMEATSFSKKSVEFGRTTRLYIPEDRSFHKPTISFFLFMTFWLHFNIIPPSTTPQEAHSSPDLQNTIVVSRHGRQKVSTTHPSGSPFWRQFVLTLYRPALVREAPS
jgi:hypothetical protein